MGTIKMKTIPFKIKLFFSVGAIFLTLALVVCFLFSNTSIRNARENDNVSSDIILERVSTQIDSLYEQMNIASTSLTKNPVLKAAVLTLNMPESEKEPTYIQELEQERTIQTALGNMMFSPIISNVNLYNQSKNYFYYSGTYYDDMDYVYEKLASDHTRQEFHTRSVVYRPPVQNPWTPDENIVLSVIRNFSDLQTTLDTIVEVQVSYRLLDDICTQDSFQDEKEILILDSDGEIVYPYGHSAAALPEETVTKLQKQIASGREMYYSADYSYFTHKSDTTDLNVVLISNNRTLKRQTFTYIATAIFAVLLILSAALGIIFTLITRVTRPLNHLIDYVNELSLDHDARLALPTGSFNEFELLGTTLSQMLSKLKASIQENYELQIRESNANLAALQAQVNPHFLYNALNSISAASEVYGSEVTAKMCQELSSMMRYVTSKKTEVSLIEELTHTRNYLDFMKISNGPNFDYTMEIPQKLHGLLVPKLSIQPFAENSFQHGFRNTMPPWQFSLICRINHPNWEILITDNGGGFSEDALSGISTEPIDASELEINGLGLNNTFSRLFLYLGDSFSYQIENLAQGCRITLKGVLKDG